MYSANTSTSHLRKEWHQVEYSQPLLAKAPTQNNAQDASPDIHLIDVTDSTQIRPTLTLLQRAFHHLNAELRDLADFLHKIQRMTPSMRNIDEYNRITFTLKKRRQKTKNSLANFVELMKKCKEQNWQLKNRMAHREFERIVQHFDEMHPRMQHLLAESVAREKEIVNHRLDELNRQQDRMEDDKSVTQVSDEQLMILEEEEEQKQKQLELASYDQSAIDAEREIGREKLNDLRLVEEEVNELLECYMDLKQTLLDQQEGIDEIQENFVQANVQAEKGIASVKQANEYQKQGNSIIYGTICLMLVVFMICSVILFALFYF